MGLTASCGTAGEAVVRLTGQLSSPCRLARREARSYIGHGWEVVRGGRRSCPHTGTDRPATSLRREEGNAKWKREEGMERFKSGDSGGQQEMLAAVLGEGCVDSHDERAGLSRRSEEVDDGEMVRW
ncbi:hypothetical protein CC85DRAFT_4525 [Cutaneotrichosporon oleaginosum]|uniref:Uncharacterized protein n=1 Tax=Cutaneotrichosporon oleaginosum TaxID=879819 RepID=A0A0J0XZS1_9TREE|nr:uncharacterized protein CC85DRAFT_4525 [Cutaneotrichosporon oleaginosum]KLT46516.1 hypothetical protein CC85DRAFT_4525 [Cutaneotrichosporon oleaginosum]TXT15117.1 hypothetical protein COLE_01310 [Cutaneotrichosporon oleaginosum]